MGIQSRIKVFHLILLCGCGSIMLKMSIFVEQWYCDHIIVLTLMQCITFEKCQIVTTLKHSLLDTEESEVPDKDEAKPIVYF